MISIGYSFCEGNMRITNLRDAVEQVKFEDSPSQNE